MKHQPSFCRLGSVFLIHEVNLTKQAFWSGIQIPTWRLPLKQTLLQLLINDWAHLKVACNCKPLSESSNLQFAISTKIKIKE